MVWTKAHSSFHCCETKFSFAFVSRENRLSYQKRSDQKLNSRVNFRLLKRFYIQEFAFCSKSIYFQLKSRHNSFLFVDWSNSRLSLWSLMNESNLLYIWPSEDWLIQNGEWGLKIKANTSFPRIFKHFNLFSFCLW